MAEGLTYKQLRQTIDSLTKGERMATDSGLGSFVDGVGNAIDHTIMNVFASTSATATGSWQMPARFLSVDVAADAPLTPIQQLRAGIGLWLKPLL